ncbi:MAG: hypothetical protein ACLQVM_23995 [Terriglobia bacterium]
MPNDLFSRLEKYGSKDNAQTENFLTELVAYLLRVERVAREEFVRLVAGKWTGEFSCGDVKVDTQYFTQSHDSRVNGLHLDMILKCGESELIVENKVGDELTSRQLRNYLDYARERDGRRVAVVSRDHQEAVRWFQADDKFLKETLWWEIADAWAGRQREFSCSRFVDGVLNFLRSHEMGPIQGFSSDELNAPQLWRKFIENRDAILKRLIKQVANPDWPKDCDLGPPSEFPVFGDKDALDYRGIVWYPQQVKTHTEKSHTEKTRKASFWYFLGFRYRELEWSPPLLQPEQPECCAFVGVWGENRIKDFLEERRSQLATTQFEFEVLRIQSAIFLCRRRALQDFVASASQVSDVLKFFMQSHDAVKSMVPEIRRRHLELIANPQRGN